MGVVPHLGPLVLLVAKATPLALTTLGFVAFTVAVTTTMGDFDDQPTGGREARKALAAQHSADTRPGAELGDRDLTPAIQPLVFLVTSDEEVEGWLARLDASNVVAAAIGEPLLTYTVIAVGSPVKEKAIQDGVHLENQVRGPILNMPLSRIVDVR